MVAFIDAERETYGVEPMGAVLPIAPATYFRHKAWQAYPDQRCPRAQRDAWLTTQIQRVWDANFGHLLTSQWVGVKDFGSQNGVEEEVDAVQCPRSRDTASR